jgi:AsmA-like protein
MTANVMRSKRRGCLIALGVATVILLCGAFLVYRALDPDALRGVAEGRLSAVFGERVTIGRMRVALFPPAVTGTDVSIGTRSKGAAPSVGVRRIRIVPQWRTLLSKPVVIDAVEIEGLAVALLRDRDGRWVLPGASRGGASAGGAGGAMTGVPGLPGGPGTAPVAVRSVRLRDGRLVVVDAAPSAAKGPREVGAITDIDARLEEGPNGVATASMDAKLGSSPVTGRLESRQQGLSAELHAPSIRNSDLPTVFALLGSSMPAGLSIQEPAPLDLTLQIARATGALTASGGLRARTVRFGTLEVGTVSAPFRVAHDSVIVDPLAFSAYRGTGRATLRVQYGKAPASWTLDTRTDRVDINALLSAATTARDRLLGTGRVAGGLQGTAQAPFDRHITGTLDITVSDGVIRNFALLAGLNRALRITGGDARDTKFQRLSATIAIAHGVLRTTNLLLEAGELSATGAGTITFERAIDMTGTAVFSREASARMIATVKEISGAKNERGEVEVPFGITGTTDNPQFSVKMDQILGRALKKEIQRNLKKGLDQLFRKPQP